MSPDLPGRVAARIGELGVDEASVRTLRADYPGIHFTFCSDDDIHQGRPIVEGEGFRLYLIDGADHCLGLTRDVDTATGLVLALMDDDDDDDDD